MSDNIENFPGTQFTVYEINTLQHFKLVKSVLLAGKQMVMIYRVWSIIRSYVPALLPHFLALKSQSE